MHDLPSTSWRTRKACNVIQSKSKGLEKKNGSGWYNSQSEAQSLGTMGQPTGRSPRVQRPRSQEHKVLGQEKMDIPCQEKTENSPFL